MWLQHPQQRQLLLLMPLLAAALWASRLCVQQPGGPGPAGDQRAARSPRPLAGATASTQQRAAADGSRAGSSSRRLFQTPDQPAIDPAFGGATMQELVLSKGYPLEQHKVATPDGWLLNLFRIPHGRLRHTAASGRRPVVLLYHGNTLSSACWVLFNPNESLGFILADAGFDVWMANTRANTFSRGNMRHSYRSTEYWQHSLDEYALIDAPAQIDRALAVSGARRLALVGHSQGSTIAYAMLAALPHMNQKVSVTLHLGPVVYPEFIRISYLRQTGNDQWLEFIRLAGAGEFLWWRWWAPFRHHCTDWAWNEACVYLASQLYFGPSRHITPDDMVLAFNTWPASVSSRNGRHSSQMMGDGQLRFQRYDHGTNCSRQPSTQFRETCNQAVYGSLSPPEYQLGRISAPQAIFSGSLDLMSSSEDVAEQVRRLPPGVLVQFKCYEGLAHLDFIWDRNMRPAADMVDLMLRFAPGTF